MPQSPSESADTVPASALDDYLAAWLAVGEMSRQGHSWSGRERHNVFLNTADGRFADISATSGADFADDGRAVAVSDWDQDGDLDLWVASRTGPRVRFLRNDLGGDSLALRLRGVRTNRDAVGARVRLHLEGETTPRIATRRAGEGFLAQSSPWIHFGLEDAPAVAFIEVAWPGGEVERFEGVDAPGRYELLEGAGVARRVPARQPVQLSPSSLPTRHTASSGARIRMTARPAMPPLDYTGFKGERRELPLGQGGALLLNLWASWCAPCVGELRELEKRRGELEAAGLSIVALSVDEEADRARALIRDIAPGYAIGFATPSGLDALDILQKALLDERRRLALPTSFLIDGQGRLAVIYKGAMVLDELVADLSILELDDFAIRAASAPLPGRWATRETPFPQSQLAAEFASFGHADIAAFYRGLAPARENSGWVTVELRRGLELRHRGRGEEAAAVLGGVVERLARYLKQRPDDIDARNQLGVALLGLDRPGTALQVFEQVLELEPNEPTALSQAALLNWRGGRKERAEELLERLARTDALGAAKLRSLLALD